MDLQKGQKLKLTDLTSARQIRISVSAQMGSGEVDCTCFGVDASGKLSDDRYFVFYNQTSTPEGAITMEAGGGKTSFAVDLDRLPGHIQKLVITIAADGGSMRDLRQSRIVLSGGGAEAEYPFDGSGFAEEKALILCELYQKDGLWRYHVVASGFNGGLPALLAHFGGQEAAPASAPVPPPAPPTPPAPPSPPKVNLSKITLKKSGETHKINLSKNSGEIHVNLNWDMKRKKLFGPKPVDLDLACMFRLKNGMQGVIQALGNSFGRADDLPYILLDQDDRTGQSSNGENMYFKRPELLEFAVVFAFIYEGVPNWRSTNAAVLLQQQGSPDIEIRIDNPDSRNPFCVLATLSASSGQLEVRREERYFSGHRAIDEFYHFGFRWVSGHK